ncbi:hypothetical protein E4U37_006557 [Claviceps purpurea]|nr:hypothetical protein E4U37_006557 [Claviceps purpurea]
MSKQSPPISHINIRPLEPTPVMDLAPAPSSPRLPSPPPPAEIQPSPNSPSDSAPESPHAIVMEQSVLDANSRRRIHPGTKAADMATGPPLVPLSELDSAFQLQEHLAALHYYHTASKTQAISRDAAVQIATPPAGIDRTIWLYELCRFLIAQCNTLIVGFLFDSPPCSATTCPEMRASEWQFLCAVHEQPKSCCAIDYCCHTLDWAANVVSDQKLFPSRFAVLSDTHSKNAGVKNLVNVFRRLHRIFAHAWFQHRSVFWSVESHSGLYILFKTVCDLYDLLPAENYKLPPEAEGLDATPAAEAVVEVKPTPVIMKPPSEQGQNVSAGGPEDDSMLPGGRTNTRRHIRSSPSTGSSVTTVLETDEEEADSLAGKMRGLHISNYEEPEHEELEHEEPEPAEEPVVVVKQASVAETVPQDSEYSVEQHLGRNEAAQSTIRELDSESDSYSDSDSSADMTVVDETESRAAQGQRPVIHSVDELELYPTTASELPSESEPVSETETETGTETQTQTQTESESGYKLEPVCFTTEGSTEIKAEHEPKDEPQATLVAQAREVGNVDSSVKEHEAQEAQKDDAKSTDMMGETGQVVDPE